MVTMVEQARGAAFFGMQDRQVQQSVCGAAVFTRQTLDPEWEACIAELQQFRA